MKRSVLGIAALALVFSATAAEAQKPFSIGVTAGASMPMGDFGDIAATGWNAGGVLGISAPTLPVGLRVDASYNSFSFSDDYAAIAGDESWNILAITGNATWGLPMTAPMSPYLIGGAGLYRVNSSIDGSEAQSEFGFNVGGGLKFNLSGFATFVEARYNSIQGDGGSTSYVPITFGIMF